MTLEESLEVFNRIANSGSLELPQETLDAIRDCIADPTGLRPFMREQIEQSDELSEQVSVLQNSLEEQISFAKEERARRIQGDKETMGYTKKWNRINFAIAMAAMLFGFGAFIIALLTYLDI